MHNAGEMNLSAFAGTHQFLSPEIAEGAANFSGAKGMYSFCLSYCLNSLFD